MFATHQNEKFVSLGSEGGPPYDRHQSRRREGSTMYLGSVDEARWSSGLRLRGKRRVAAAEEWGLREFRRG